MLNIFDKAIHFPRDIVYISRIYFLYKRFNEDKFETHPEFKNQIILTKKEERVLEKNRELFYSFVDSGNLRHFNFCSKNLKPLY